MPRKNTPTWLEEVRRIMRLKHYSLHTERTYSDWIKQFVRFHQLTEKDALFVESEVKVEPLFKRVGNRAECSDCRPTKKSVATLLGIVSQRTCCSGVQIFERSSLAWTS
ncbi:hypothetical protein Nwat_1025 [Nitrosococcus watsonii C-113]|uniref:Integrase SAM-like N-terminal domain-containing protein n=1 Tax=Nitrosococcus watsoni (strain C-113) TaxID=105559 RepID=D8K4Z0_NITWC|nr:hypothetical protein Nwat_1025 [Nitrosococcus watsonii C-113]